MVETIIKELKKIKTNNSNVTKRDGKTEEFNAEKINKILLWATNGLSGVSASDVAMNAHIQFYPGIKTVEINKVLIQ
jgi:ribonucleoside-diphosphate reductase alpha chain